ncbi:MAG TPA: GNAT family N-acetyltransferase, partial [Hyphomicrobiaceae bacterium]|nr:GNAT family N-acetyltransferase [Hyphomicrobiaceae bacterium]
MCMASRPDARRSGGARAVLAAIEHWAGALGAGTLFLQTGADNAAAQALYAGVGYGLAGRYHVRIA